MHIGDPAIAVTIVRICSSKRKATIIEIDNLALQVAHPYQRRHRIRHRLEASFAFSQDGFGSSLSRSLSQQGGNQERLSEYQYYGTNQPVFVSLPKRGLTVQNDTPWR